MVTLTSYSTSFVHFSAMTSSTGVRGATASPKQRTPRSACDTVMRVTRAEVIQRVGCSSALAVGVLLAPRRAIAEETKDEVQQFDEMRGQIEKKGKEDVVRHVAPSLYTVQYSRRCQQRGYCSSPIPNVFRGVGWLSESGEPSMLLTKLCNTSSVIPAGIFACRTYFISWNVSLSARCASRLSQHRVQ